MIEPTYPTQLEMSQSLRYYHNLTIRASIHSQRRLGSPVQNMLVIASYLLSMSLSVYHTALQS